MSHSTGYLKRNGSLLGSIQGNRRKYSIMKKITGDIALDGMVHDFACIPHLYQAHFLSRAAVLLYSG